MAVPSLPSKQHLHAQQERNLLAGQSVGLVVYLQPLFAYSSQLWLCGKRPWHLQQRAPTLAGPPVRKLGANETAAGSSACSTVLLYSGEAASPSLCAVTQLLCLCG